MRVMDDMQPGQSKEDFPMTQTAESDNLPMNEKYDDDDDDEDGLNWVLGFAEAPLGPLDLLRHRFPSKIGGRPAWLDPMHLPSLDHLHCPSEGTVMKFLLQIYAPVDDNPEAFHRSLFIFISPRAKGLHATPAGVQVFRCQLPRSNEFYDFDPPSPNSNCGPKQMHQSPEDPWAVGEYEQAVVHQNANVAPSTVELFPEYEIVVEDEPVGMNIHSKHSLEQDNTKEMECTSQEPFTEEELPSELVDQIENSMPVSQRHFAAFAARVSTAPAQILRYCFENGASPLCPSPDGIPPPDSIPPCPHCHGPRRFEFQVMPQLLNKLGIDPSDDDALDWGTIAIYSCAISCNTASAGVSYSKEFAWVQPAG